jgi:hypothetical protein
MAVVNDRFKGGVPGALFTVGMALAAPIVLPALAVGARPLAKTLIKGCLAAAEAVQEVVEETRAQMSTLVAEAQEERAAASAATSTTTGAESTET